MRYSNNKITNNPSTGKRSQRTFVIENIPEHPNDQYLEVTTVDRLDLIAHTYYGNRDLWWIIAQANGIGKGTVYISEGTILRLPANPNQYSTGANLSSGY